MIRQHIIKYELTILHKHKLILKPMEETNIYDVLDESPLESDKDEWKHVKKHKTRFQDDSLPHVKERYYKRPKDKDNDYMYSEKNKKKILCNNVLNFGKCNYNDKCLYAHSYEEQNVDPQRKQLYDHIKSNDKWEIDLSKDDRTAKQLMVFTKVCSDCENNKCPGGYNCKYGVMNKKYQICYKDIYYGACDNLECTMIHLTQRGIIPSHPIKKSNIDTTINNATNLPEGKLLTNTFFLLNQPHEKCDDSDSDSDTSVEQIQAYLDKNDDIDQCEKSIFITK